MAQARKARMLPAGVAALAVAFGLVGCQSGPARTAASGETAAPVAALSPDATAPKPESTVAPLKHRVRADVLVTAAKPMSSKLVHKLDRLQPAAAAVTIDVGKVWVQGRMVQAVAVDPSRFRKFAPPGTAESQGVWETVARGEAIVAHDSAKKLKLKLGEPFGVAANKKSPVYSVRLGALATTLPDADIIVNRKMAQSLGLHRATGVLLSAGKRDPARLASAVKSVIGKKAHIDLLSAPAANPMAFLTGSSAAAAFGAFSYRYFKDGTIQPDAGWVAANIRQEAVPILGVVTCHRLMLPQLRGALTEIVKRGLASKIHRGQYGGCYVPRFIERNPNRSISLHTWGIAIDLNVASNQLHTHGSMDPRVVAIFKHWGFRWGGDWTTPVDPMHFELAALLN